MTNFARVVNNVAIDVSVNPTEFYHPDVASQFIEVPDEVMENWVLTDGVWSAPLPPAPPVPQPINTDLRITKLAFLNRMTVAERIGIRAASDSNPVVRDFMALIDAATFIDLARPDAEQGVAYLVSQSLLTAERAEEVLTAPVQDSERPVFL